MLIAIGLAIYRNAEVFRQMVRAHVIAAVNGSIRGSLMGERLEDSTGGNVLLNDVRSRYQDMDIVQVARLRLSYVLVPLLCGHLRITRAETP